MHSYMHSHAHSNVHSYMNSPFIHATFVSTTSPNLDNTPGKSHQRWRIRTSPIGPMLSTNVGDDGFAKVVVEALTACNYCGSPSLDLTCWALALSLRISFSFLTLRYVALRYKWIGPELQLHAIVTAVRYGRTCLLTPKNFLDEERNRSRGWYPLIFDCFLTIFDHDW